MSFTILLGWLVLAFGAWRSGALHAVRCVGLAAASLMPLGVLKGTTILSTVGALGLCVALVPTGIGMVLSGPRPRARTVWLALAAVPTTGLLAYVSTLG